MDESDGLENRCGGNVTVGSNPTLSAMWIIKKARTTRKWSGPFCVVPLQNIGTYVTPRYLYPLVG